MCLEQCKDFYEIYPRDSFGWTKYHLGRTYAMKGDNHNSELMLLQAIDIFEKNNDLNAQGCAYSVLALAYSQEGDYSKAIQTYKKANDFIEPLLGKEHVDIANNERWCGEAYAKIGNVQEAKKCYMKAIDIYQKKGCKIPQYETELLLDKILSEK